MLLGMGGGGYAIKRNITKCGKMRGKRNKKCDPLFCCVIMLVQYIKVRCSNMAHVCMCALLCTCEARYLLVLPVGAGPNAMHWSHWAGGKGDQEYPPSLSKLRKRPKLIRSLRVL